MAHNYEFRFEIKPGKFVYIQRPDAILRGRKIISRVEKRYHPDSIFFHIGRRGGHISALRLHQKNSLFSRFDLSDFFGNVSRGKLIRALRRIGFTEARAMEYAIDSVVVDNGRKHIPFGFCQSPLMATLALERSMLGIKLKEISNSNIAVSVYMDDILISGDDPTALVSTSHDLIEAAAAAGFPLSPEKMAISSESVNVFNCRIQKDKVTILDDRMTEFTVDYSIASEFGRDAIEKYIESVAPDELDRFRTLS